MSRKFSLWMFLGLLCALTACGDDDSTTDGGTEDASTDAAADTSEPDTSVPDAAPDVAEDTAMDTSDPGCTEGCDFVEITTGAIHSCVRRDNGEILCWGSNFFGQLGDGRMSHSVCDPESTEPDDCSARPVVADVEGSTRVIANGSLQTCSETTDGIYCWGRDVLSEVGTDTHERRFFPDPYPDVPAGSIEISTHNACVVDGTGAVQCIGDNDSRQLADGGNDISRTPVAIADLAGVTELDISRGRNAFMCARNASGLHCWGDNLAGQLGDGEIHESCGSAISERDCSSTPVTVTGSADAGFTNVDLGSQHACAINADGAVVCWGAGGRGQIGNGEVSDTDTPTTLEVAGVTFTQVALGGGHSCALSDDGDVYCWGSNSSGQIGIGGEVGTFEACSDEQNQCVLTPTQVTLPAAATMIDSGGAHTCALLEGNRVFCWGTNDSRQLGRDERGRVMEPHEVTFEE